MNDLQLCDQRSILTQVQQLDRIVQELEQRLAQVRSGQESLLTDAADIPELDLAVRFQPAREAGGDFYELVRLSDNCIGILVADVAGHDLSSAYTTGALKALTATFTNESLSTHETMIMLNAGLIKFLDEDQYVTASYAKFYRSEMVLDMICAGHPAPVHQPVDSPSEPLEMVGDALGMFESAHFESCRIQVHPGERLFLFTDGLIESSPDVGGSLGNRLFGLRKLTHQLNRLRSVPVREVVNRVVDDLLQERNGSMDDDVVLIGVEF